MTTVILPGYSAHNKDWAEEVAKNLKIGGEIRPIFWAHWTDPEKYLRPKEKAQDIVDILKGDRANLIAKSVGTLVAAYVVRSIPDQVSKVVLCGIPSTSDERLEIFREAFANFPVEKVICFQNEHDPFKTPKDIEDFMEKVHPQHQKFGVGVKVEPKQRNDHHYPYYEDFNKFFS